jgi:membrane peptidoglycan carboxypeptidase
MASISMGQEIGVTPLQLVSAYSAIANGGTLFQPRIVSDVYRGNEHDPAFPAAGHRVISERVAGIMRELLAGVVEHGTGIPAKPDGYSAAGKTGTAQLIDSSGRYSRSRYVASFAGFVPAERPAITILVVIDSPVGQIYGAEVAAPAFRAIAEQTLAYLHLPQENRSAVPLTMSLAQGGSPPQPRDALRKSRLSPSASLDAESISVSPARPVAYTPGSSAGQQGPESPKLSSDPSDSGIMLVTQGALVSVPDFNGWPVRRVAERCQALGLDLNIRGSGLAIIQNPAAGTSVSMESTVSVQFSR